MTSKSQHLEVRPEERKTGQRLEPQEEWKTNVVTGILTRTSWASCSPKTKAGHLCIGQALSLPKERLPNKQEFAPIGAPPVPVSFKPSREMQELKRLPSTPHTMGLPCTRAGQRPEYMVYMVFCPATQSSAAER